MPKHSSVTRCPRCGEPASGQFCAGCGAALSAQSCTSCGKPVSAGARFCHHCGAAVSAAAEPSESAPSRGGMPQAWTIAAGVVILLIAFVAGQRLANAPGEPGDPGDPLTGPAATSQSPAAAIGTTDIANMSPEEAASRLFDRVMRYSSAGKVDSAAIFAPMAIQSYAAIGPPDAHARYDIGTISVVIGDAAAATAQADTILKAQPNHLLALILAAKAADLRKDVAAATKFRARFTAALPTERAKGLKEYSDHQNEIQTASGTPATTRP